MASNQAEGRAAQAGSAEPAAAAHTPGPWRVLEWADDKKGFIAIVAGEQDHICDVFPFGVRAKHASLEQHNTNARLIAAAPELLEALKMARDCIAYCRRAHKDAQSGEGFPAELLLDAAIAKAEGK